eukprot:TRINITY_DN3788_c0_g1_i9.p1 TRINITY_DN3788_c0_g1~~TRINITY_DN3788_c0_g1_i9.p1  ORF type:complete len:513 (-),score=56.87 TRINITY_DN3788_c0_g1_i9:279-1817(-)
MHSHVSFQFKTNYNFCKQCYTRSKQVSTRVAELSIAEKTNQFNREGGQYKPFVQKQAHKEDVGQSSILNYLEPFDAQQSKLIEVIIVGSGPAGLALAGALAKENIFVVVVSPDLPFTNNYGVWYDEFKDIGLAHTLSHTWKDTKCYFGDQELDLGRAYSQVSKDKLRDHLLRVCSEWGVKYVKGQVVDIQDKENGKMSKVVLSDGVELVGRLVCLAAGGAAGKFLEYEKGAPPVTAQTAYGIEAEVEGYEAVYPPHRMLFMDYRRHHSGYWEGCANQNGSDAHGASISNEVPSFLYAMHLGENRVFLEETCLVSRPAMSFDMLKRRLYRRLDALGIKVKNVMDEEWSYIPVGGPLPVGNQNIVAFGASASLVHPATGYSIARSLREAPLFAREIAPVLRQKMSSKETAQAAWNAIWPIEKRAQASFHVFGMELLSSLPLYDIESFFAIFFNLPKKYWEGFLASTLSSFELLMFAVLTYIYAPLNVRWALLKHMVSDPSMMYLMRCYLKIFTS